MRPLSSTGAGRRVAACTSHFWAREFFVPQKTAAGYGVRGDEILARGTGLPLQGWRNAMAAQNLSNGLIRELMPQVRKRADNAVVTPTRILSGHLHDQSHYLRRDRRPTWTGATFRTMELLGHQPPIRGRIVSGLATTAI
jgi:hypothetical protein